MSSTTGLSWKICRYVDITPINIGGIPSRFGGPVKHTEVTQEAGTGQRRLLNLSAQNIYYELSWQMKLQKLTDYITAYGFVDQEGSLSSHKLFVTDGISPKGFTDVYVDRCEITVGQTGSATADITAYALTPETKSLTVTYDTINTITKAGYAVTVGSTSVTKFLTVRMAVENNVRRVATGSGSAITEVYARSPVYSGRIELVRVGDPLFGFGSTVKQNVVIAITDNQGTPVTKTFTFTNAACNSNSIHVEELDLTEETLNWTGDKLVIT